MILVTAATGNIGREAVRALSAKGIPVRALTRDPARASFGPGVEVAKGDLDHPETLAAALEGVERALLISPGPNTPAQELGFIEAGRRAGLRQVAMVSSLGIEFDVGGGPSHVPGEAALRASGLPWTLLRPNAFMSNALMWAATIRAQGTIYEPSGSGRHAAIHPRDIAEAAVKVLTTPGHEGKIYSLTGSEAYSTAEAAKLLGELVGRPLQHVDIPDAAFRAELAKAGLPEGFIDPFARFYALVKSGEGAYVRPDLEALLGRKAIPFAQWAQENVNAFR